MVYRKEDVTIVKRGCIVCGGTVIRSNNVVYHCKRCNVWIKESHLPKKDKRILFFVDK